MDILLRLQEWYASQCDGDWEHQFGIHLDTLDNPGWKLTIDLEGTDLEMAQYTTQRWQRTDQEWIWCEVKERRFEARGGCRNLVDALQEFLGWADSVTASNSTGGE